MARSRLPAARAVRLFHRPDRGAFAPIMASRVIRRDAARLRPGGLKWRDEFAGLQSFGEQDHLFAWAAELLDILVLDAAELRHQRCGFLALTVRRERDRTNDGLVFVAVQIFCDSFLVE